MPLPKEDLDYILSQTKGLWYQFENASIFMTGATGFVGSWLLETFLHARNCFQLNLKVTALSRHSHQHPDVNFIQGDVRHFDLPNEVYTHIIHAATEACAKSNAENPQLMFDTIVEGTRRLLKSAKSGCFLYISSGAVYELNKPNTHLKADKAYAVGKLCAEYLCSLSQLDIKIARLFAFVGPRLPLTKHFAIGNFIHDLINDRAIHVRGDGTPYRSYLYAADMVIWLLYILCQGKTMFPYNVGSDKAVTIAELAQLVAAQSPHHLPVYISQTQTYVGEPERYVPNVTQTRTEFNLHNDISLIQSIQKTIAYAKSQ